MKERQEIKVKYLQYLLTVSCLSFSPLRKVANCTLFNMKMSKTITFTSHHTSAHLAFAGYYTESPHGPC